MRPYYISEKNLGKQAKETNNYFEVQGLWKALIA